MIRVLHSVSNMDRAGVETMLMNYYRYIDREQIQFDFLANKPKPGAYEEEVRELGGRIFVSPGFNPIKLPKYRKYTKKLFEDNPEIQIAMHTMVLWHIMLCGRHKEITYHTALHTVIIQKLTGI